MNIESLPSGVSIIPLVMHRDERGYFTEIFRQEWSQGFEPVQWNLVSSQPGVLRGVHVHIRHTDYLIVAGGHATIGLKDLRDTSTTSGLACALDIRGDELVAIVTPPGVAHGFYFHEPSAHIYAVSNYWDKADELGCHWKDPDLDIPWPINEARLSERDAKAQTLENLLTEMKVRGFNR